MNKQKVFIIDDSDAARIMLKNILEKDELIEVVGEGKTGQAAVIMLDEYKPDVVLLEANMTGGMRLEDVVREIRNVDGNVKIILCVDVLSYDKIVSTDFAGADDFVFKPYRKRTLLRILKRIREEV